MKFNKGRSLVTKEPQPESWELPQSPFNPDNILEREGSLELYGTSRDWVLMVATTNGNRFHVRKGCLHWVKDLSSGTCRFKCGD